MRTAREPARGRAIVRAAARAASTAAAVLAAACAAGAPGLDARATRAPATTRIAFGAGTVAVEMLPDDRVVEAPLSARPDQVWALLPAVYAALDLPVTTLLADQRLVGTQGARVPRRLGGEALSRAVGCGIGPLGQENADLYEVTLLALTEVRAEEGGGSLLRTLVRGSARTPGTSDVPVRCTSRGRVEQRIEELVRRRIAAAAR